eukprot:gene15013-biopygen665
MYTSLARPGREPGRVVLVRLPQDLPDEEGLLRAALVVRRALADAAVPVRLDVDVHRGVDQHGARLACGADEYRKHAARINIIAPTRSILQGAPRCGRAHRM